MKEKHRTLLLDIVFEAKKHYGYLEPVRCLIIVGNYFPIQKFLNIL